MKHCPTHFEADAVALHHSRSGASAGQVARDLGIGQATVDLAVASGRPPKYKRKPVPTSFAPGRGASAGAPGGVPTDACDGAGREGRLDRAHHLVPRQCAPAAPGYRSPDPADRLVREPSDAAQCDLWFQPKRLPLEDGSSLLGRRLGRAVNLRGTIVLTGATDNDGCTTALTDAQIEDISRRLRSAGHLTGKVIGPKMTE